MRNVAILLHVNDEEHHINSFLIVSSMHILSVDQWNYVNFIYTATIYNKAHKMKLRKVWWKIGSFPDPTYPSHWSYICVLMRYFSKRQDLPFWDRWFHRTFNKRKYFELHPSKLGFFSLATVHSRYLKTDQWKWELLKNSQS